jgi:polysaccharide deacetylase family protein (PEP-CTERM system associated)
LFNALTIDVEDFFQVTAFERQIKRSEWSDFRPRVIDNTQRLLALLEEHQVRATFYVLGWIADKFPRLVREISDQGHEIGSHSYWHRLIYSLSPQEFREDLRRSRDVLQDATGQRVISFRAPSFSITRKSLWAFDILGEEGFESDSSVFPTRHDRYGIQGAPLQIHPIEAQTARIWEFPMTVVERAGMNIPVSGGGYFRLYPLSWTTRWLQQVNDAQRPFVFYLHPWEIDPQQPRLRAGSRFSRWRHYVNLSSTESKLTTLLRLFQFAPLTDVLNDALPTDHPIASAERVYLGSRA